MWRWPLTLVAVGVVPVLFDCSAQDSSVLRYQVERLIRPEMGLVAAEQALQQVGFRCGPAYSAGEPPSTRTCSRLLATSVIATCVQRVHLTPVAGGAVLGSFKVPFIPCGSV
jgi:hypothetical protein